ncbi:pyruvoyl-dependent arginine decarboxylase [Haloarcula hispanica N601]|uniref:arginine decarboxylase n=3 Tax=Haloarcula hispanica TaxID=51589 RepID=A0A482TFK3_HALHI|nr:MULTISPECIES: pyruvoyl-dependent arginine decarboxylase [Haloarcula]AEM56081.1 pyruvoyl-dependent arginine decarboxylase [Haloarcula hispanica ATCC 33960]AHB64894.1 pyruvoyl-dependent arginine decarboxylase [Haloarcula hispanica N601]KAA9408814.1 pyruvoyl-dependent arginine decarboxylase [Haloarcula hispanica]KZX49470.1 pyruvoyl-dependent arginine decarboxylase [Haloarcula sp. K1]MCJ0620815.1 pyruvoyl-dependent arginine decarboxylase [Haloarcula hispanica]
MSTIRVVWGTATGPTALAAYDAALAEAGVHNYNLISLSSVIPTEPAIEVTGTAPDLGPPGEALEVVQSSATAEPGESVAAGIGWARSEDGPGIFYEVDGTSEDAVRMEIREGLAAGRDLRDWEFVEENVYVESATDDAQYASAVVLATYGESHPVV